MNIHHCPNRCRPIVAGCLLALCAPAWAGGIFLYEAGHEGSALANAGAAVLATDPSVLMNNPAGISRLHGTQVNANAQVILGDMHFSRDDANTYSGNEGGNPLTYIPGSSLFVTHELDERLSIGFGLYGNFGLALDYDDDWAGRYFTQESAILGISLQPTIAYKFSDDLSIGFGPRFMYGFFRTEVAVNNNVLGTSNADDGQLRYKDTDWGTGFNIGMLYRIDERTEVGLAYTSAVDLKFRDKPQLKHITNPLLNLALKHVNVDGLDVDMTVPQTLTASAAYQLNGQWKLLGSLGWQDWSEFGHIGVQVDTDAAGTTASADRQYHDTWHAAIGAQNQLSPQLRWNIGLGYDSSAVKDKDRTVDNPMNDTWRLATGVNYALEKDLDLHLNYTLVWLGDMSVSQTQKRSGTQVSGEYSNTALHVVGAGLTWRF